MPGAKLVWDLGRKRLYARFARHLRALARATLRARSVLTRSGAAKLGQVAASASAKVAKSCKSMSPPSAGDRATLATLTSLRSLEPSARPSVTQLDHALSQQLPPIQA